MTTTSVASQQAEDRYTKTHVYHDPVSGFTMNLAGFPVIADLTRVLKKYSYGIQQALKKIDEVESGAIANKTAVKAESENRAVDHYNLRLDEERVPGKSLKHSLALWDQVNESVKAILNGTVKNEKGERYTDAVFNGIGGSYLGPLMLVIAMKGDGYNFNSGLPVRLHFTANTDPDSFALLMSKLNLDTTIMVNMSKSGTTAETKGNMDAFNALLKQKNLTPGAHNIAITTKGSKFDQYAQQEKFMNIFHMFDETGGRTSVVSAIGMVPCAFTGLNFGDFLKGQSHMDALTRHADPLMNPAMLVAIAIDALTKEQGRKNMIVLGYSDFLKEFAHYLQQLYMESLGKEYDEAGIIQPEGQTVFGGIGTGEQHAFMQQIQKGIPDSFVRFVHFLKRKHDYPNEMARSIGRQLLGFVKGTEDALLNNGKPYISSTFLTCDMFNMGMMVALEERIVSILATFKKVNAYDQPGVQDGKLAATAVNELSKQIENVIAEKASSKGWSWSGDALKARHDFISTGAPIWYVDAILSDIFANVDIEHSYAKLQSKISVNRSFEQNRFVYTISSRL